MMGSREKVGQGHTIKERDKTAVTCPHCGNVFVTEKDYPSCSNRACGKTFPTEDNKMVLAKK